MNERDGLLLALGRRVREKRTARGFSQESFAAACGLDRTYIGGVERGERNASLCNLWLIAKTLDCSLSELFEGVSGE